jgi:glycosyltransferase involved in cell wall biosynthesis
MDRGGAELRVLDVMRFVDRTRFRLEFCALSGRPGSLDEEIRALGGEVHPCGVDPGFAFRFAALLRRRRIDVVHSHVFLASGVVLTLAAAAGVRLRIVHLHSTEDGRGHSPVRRAYRWTMRVLLDRFATHVLAVGEGAMEQAWRPGWRTDPRCHLVVPGIDPRAFDLPDARADVRAELRLPEDAALVLHVGRFDPPKNHERLIRIFAALARHHPAHLVLAGRGGTPEERRFAALAAASGLGPRVHRLGERSDVPRLLAAADLLLLPSLHEGLPGAVLEACAAGTPVLATDLPGVREIAVHLPGLLRQRLEDDDEAWAATARDALVRAPTPAQRHAVRELFGTTPFTVQASATLLTTLWEQARTK